jgi:hypothetical protein
MLIHDMHETGFTGAWVSHDADNCCLTVYTAILLLMYALYYMLYALCLTSIYFTTVSCCKIIQLLYRVLLKLNKFNILSNLWNHSKHSFFIKPKQFQHDMSQKILHNLNSNCKTYSNTLNQFNTLHSYTIS